jgi:hypothetical protein
MSFRRLGSFDRGFDDQRADRDGLAIVGPERGCVVERFVGAGDAGLQHERF